MKKAINNVYSFQTPRVGLEPTTPRLTAVCSTIELSRITYIIIAPHLLNCKRFFICTFKTAYKKSFIHLPITLLGHALDRLVSVSSMCYHTSTSDLSTSSSSRGLTTFVGISHLEGGFTLRCLQRLSRPGLATLPCIWRCNRSTSGQSIPVLSY